MGSSINATLKRLACAETRVHR